MGWGPELIRSMAGQTVTGLVMLAIAITLEVAAPRGRLPMASRLRGLAFLMLQGILIAGPFTYALTRLWALVPLAPLVVLPLDTALGWAGPAAPVLEIVTGLLVLDLFEYAYHRIQHVALWPLHGVHHSVEDLSAATNYGHFLETPFRQALLLLPYSLVVLRHGPQPVIIPWLLAMKETWIHSPTRLGLGPLRYLVVDNVYHRIHHSKDPAHLGKNYALITPLWDVVFGTAYFPKPGEWPATGVDGLPEPKTFGAFLLLPWRVLQGGGVSDGGRECADGTGDAKVSAWNGGLIQSEVSPSAGPGPSGRP